MLLVLQADLVADYVNAPLCLIYTSRNENSFEKIPFAVSRMAQT